MANDILHDAIMRTQKSLGAIIQHPRLTSKLLARPPFRFLYDIVMELVRVYDFGKGAFVSHDFPADTTFVCFHRHCYLCIGS